MPIKPLAELAALPGPYEILDLTANQEITLRIDRYEQGQMMITPRDGRPAKAIPVLRVWVPAADKVAGMPYYDITGQHAQAMLLGPLDAGLGKTHHFKITKRGGGPASRPEITITPGR